MKKIIDGKVYNTETAALLGEWSNGYHYSDFQYVGESLYQTKKGQYFIEYEGGAMSEYAIIINRSSSGSSGIFLLTEYEAKNWAEEKLSADEFITLFGEVEEG